MILIGRVVILLFFKYFDFHFNVVVINPKPNEFL